MARQQAIQGSQNVAEGSLEAHCGDWIGCLKMMLAVRRRSSAGHWAEGSPLDFQASRLPR
jgi:hypothetical protein